MAPTTPAGADVSSVNREMASESRPSEAACHDVGQVIGLAAAESKSGDGSHKAAAVAALQPTRASADAALAAEKGCVAGGQVVQLMADEGQQTAIGSTEHDDSDVITSALENLALDGDSVSAAATLDADGGDGSSPSALLHLESAAELTSHGPQHGRPVYTTGYAANGLSSAFAAAPQQRTVFRYDDRELQFGAAPALPPQTKRSAPVESDAGSVYCQPNFASKYRYGGPTEDDDGGAAAYDDGFGGERLPSDDLVRLLCALQPAVQQPQQQQRQRFGSETTASESSWDPADSPYSTATTVPSPAASSLGSAASAAAATYGQVGALSPFAHSCDESAAGSPQSWPPSPPAPLQPQLRQQQLLLLLPGSKQPDVCYSQKWPAAAYPARGTVPGAQQYAGFGGEGSCYGGSGGYVDLAAVGLSAEDLLGGDAQVPDFSPLPALTDSCTLYGELSLSGKVGGFEKQPFADCKLAAGPEDALSEQFEIIQQVIQEDLLRTARDRQHALATTTVQQQQQQLPAPPAYVVTRPSPVPALPQPTRTAPKQQPPQLQQQQQQMLGQPMLPSPRAVPQVIQGMPATSPSLSPTVVPTTVSAVTCSGGGVQQAAPVILIVQGSPPGLTTSPQVAPTRKLPKERLILPRMDAPAPAKSSSPPATNALDAPKAKANAANEGAASKATAGPCLEKRLLAARRAVAAIPDNDLRLQDAEGNTYLHRVILKPDAYLVRAILERLYRSESMRGMVNLTNKAGQTAVYLATVKNHKLIVELLVQCNADVNIHARFPDFQAPLHHAASYGERTLDVLHCLLKARFIDLTIKLGSSGRTPLHCAILSHRRADAETNSPVNAIATVRALLAAGARLDVQDEVDGCTPLHHAVASGCFELVREVVTAASVPSVDSALRTVTRQGDTCLHLAAASRPASMPAMADRTAILHLLVKQGARIAALNLRRQRPSDLLLQHDDAELKRLMME